MNCAVGQGRWQGGGVGRVGDSPVWEGTQLEDGLCPGVHGQAEQQDTHQVHQEASPHLQRRQSKQSSNALRADGRRWLGPQLAVHSWLSPQLTRPTAGSAQMARLTAGSTEASHKCRCFPGPRLAPRSSDPSTEGLLPSTWLQSGLGLSPLITKATSARLSIPL